VPDLRRQEGDEEVLGLRRQKRRQVHLVARRRLQFLLEILLLIV
jgi:hypothetical protein